MKLADVIAVLKAAEPSLRPLGVTHAAVFGSVARGDQNAGSDIDIAVDLDPTRSLTIFDYVAVKHRIEDLFHEPVDVVDREAIKPHLRHYVARDLVYAF
jgi:predicted nucleotidyltransferase